MAQQIIDTTTDHGTYKGDPAKVAFEKTNANDAELYSLVAAASGQSMDRGAISSNGLLLSFSGSTLTLSPGVAYIPSLGKLLAVGAAISKVLSGMAQNTWYHNYLFAKADGSPDFETVTTAPSAAYFGTARTKSGDTTRRYLGSIRVGAGGVLKFEHHGSQVMYLEDTNASPFLVLAAGTSTTTATVSAAQVAPVTSYAVSLVALNAVSNNAYVRLSNSRGPAAQSGYMLLVAPNSVSAAAMPVDGAQAYTYAYDATPTGSTYHRINGYYFER
jgi:hypothetical protein